YLTAGHSLYSDLQGVEGGQYLRRRSKVHFRQFQGMGHQRVHKHSPQLSRELRFRPARQSISLLTPLILCARTQLQERIASPTKTFRQTAETSGNDAPPTRRSEYEDG